MPIAPFTFDTPDASGNAYPALASGVQGGRAVVPAMVKDVIGTWEAKLVVPPDYGAATNPSVVVGIMANAAAGVTRLELQYGAAPSNGMFFPSLAQATVTDITVPATAWFTADWRVPIPAGSLQPLGILSVKLVHQGSVTSDTLAADTLVSRSFLDYVASA